MSKLFKSRVLVLQRRQMGEADEAVTFFSPQLGRFDGVARGSRRTRSTFAGKLEPFNELEAFFAKGRSISYLTQAQVVKTRPFFYGDLSKLCWGSYFLDLFFHTIIADEPAPELYTLLTNTLDAVNNFPNLPLLGRRTELHLLNLLGFSPVLDKCSICGAVQGARYFAPAEGGLCCARCLQVSSSRRYISESTLDLLRTLTKMSLDEAVSLSVDDRTLRETEMVLWDHLQYHWPCSIRSRRLLNLGTR